MKGYEFLFLFMAMSFFTHVQGAQVFREDLWPPRVRFPLPLVWVWSWVRLRSSNRVLLSELGLFKWLEAVLSCLDRSQEKCWCKSCKVNLPPPRVTCSLIVFYFISRNIPNLSVWQATRCMEALLIFFLQGWKNLPSGSLLSNPSCLHF